MIPPLAMTWMDRTMLFFLFLQAFIFGILFTLKIITLWCRHVYERKRIAEMGKDGE